MTPTPPQDLETLAAHITDRLATAAERRQGAWRTPVLTTVAGSGAPSGRTVVIRSVDPGRRRIEVFSDAGAAKVTEIAAEPRVSFTFWDPEAGEQLRIAARAHRVTDGAAVDARWRAIGPRGHALYGTAPDEARDRFAVIQAVWHEWDWLWIGGAPHRRARFHWDGDEGPRAVWIAP